MARIRTLKAEFWKSKTVAKLPYRTRLTCAGLITGTLVDDDGRLRDDVNLIRADIWPQDPDVTDADVAEDLMLINTVMCTDGIPGMIIRYERKGMKCIAIRSWKEHQRISHPAKSKLPPPPRISRNLPRASGLFAPDFDLKRLEEDLKGGGVRGGGSKDNGRVQAPKSNPKAKTKPKTPAGKIRDDLERKRARQLADEEAYDAKRASS